MSNGFEEISSPPSLIVSKSRVSEVQMSSSLVKIGSSNSGKILMMAYLRGPSIMYNISDSLVINSSNSHPSPSASNIPIKMPGPEC